MHADLPEGHFTSRRHIATFVLITLVLATCSIANADHYLWDTGDCASDAPILILAGESDIINSYITSKKHETVSPVRVDFDGDNDVENNREHWYSGKGDRKPTTYLHSVKINEERNKWIRVKEYWYYFPDNPWFNQHEHDWESCFLYYLFDFSQKPRKKELLAVVLGYHHDFHFYKPSDLSFSGNRPIIYVDGGSHAFRTGRNNLGGHPIHQETTDMFWAAARSLKIFPQTSQTHDILSLSTDVFLSIVIDVPHKGSGVRRLTFDDPKSYRVINVLGPGEYNPTKIDDFDLSAQKNHAASAH